MIKLDQTFWVAAAFIIFTALVAKPVFKMIVKALDARGARIQKELDEALTLKEEAQAALAAYQRNQRKALEEVEEIMKHARAEAEVISQQARRALEQELNKRTEVAMEKIRQSENRVIEDIRSNTVDIVMSTARAVILENLNKEAADEMISRAISDIGRKVH